eukprot:3284761-Amphidinium_carterae.1
MRAGTRSGSPRLARRISQMKLQQAASLHSCRASSPSNPRSELRNDNKALKQELANITKQLTEVTATMAASQK